MASGKHKQPDFPDAIAEIESKGEKIIEWVSENSQIVLGVAGVLVLIAAIYGFSSNRSESQAMEASAAYEAVRSEYMNAMGAAPGALTAPELANPAAGERVREDFGQRFAAVADEHAGSSGGALATVAQGDLARDAGDGAAAIAIWMTGIEALPSDSGLVGVLRNRIAQTQEDAGDPGAAAESYLQAADIGDYAFADWALVEAARCFLEADQEARALEVAQRIEDDAPGLELPDALRTRLSELRARGSS